ncbi:MAG: succinylglutamate desuccinylase/aspartoacylase family protein [Candidatus Thorarchaeota archaeon]|jgi:predicted deacylase
MKTIQIGTASSSPGEITYGYLDCIELPTGGFERIPIIIAQGKEEGPTLFITANVHGNELTGVAVIHNLITKELVSNLKGTIVAIPTLNPSGLRLGTRDPEFDNKDPNRLFPEGMFAEKEITEDTDPPAPYEQIATKVFSYFKKYADYHIDLHNYEFRSLPFSIIDRIFYENDSQKEASEELSRKQIELVEAFGVTYSYDFPSKKYMDLKYHRSVSGALLNILRIPAFTVELGANTVVIPEVVAGSVKGTLNVLKAINMIPGEIEPITEFPCPQPDYRIRRLAHPRSPTSGIIQFLVSPGDIVSKGQAIAKISDIHGRPIGDGVIKSEYDGVMLNLQNRMTVYPEQPISEMGVKDTHPIVVPKPKK